MSETSSCFTRNETSSVCEGLSRITRDNLLQFVTPTALTVTLTRWNPPANFPKHSSSFSGASFGMKGGTPNKVIRTEDRVRGETWRNYPSMSKWLNYLTQSCPLKNTTCPLFIVEA